MVTWPAAPGSFFQRPREAEKRDPGNEFEPSLVRITTFLNDLSCIKIQHCKPAELYRYNSLSCVKKTWLLLSSFRQTSTSIDSVAVISFLIFSASEVLSVWSSVSFQITSRKFYFCNSPSSPFCLFGACFDRRDKRGIPKTMIGLCTGKIDDFQRLLVDFFELRLDVFTARRVHLVFAPLPRFATANRHIHWIQNCCERSCSFIGDTSSKSKIRYRK